MQESFNKELTKLREMGQETFVLRGSNIIVEILEPEEIKTAGGIVLTTSSKHNAGNSINAHRVEVGRVLMTGPGYWVDEQSAREIEPGIYDVGQEGKYETLEVKPGAIVLLPQYSIQPMSQFPGIQRPTGNKLAMVKMDQIFAYYPTEEAYERAKAALLE